MYLILYTCTLKVHVYTCVYMCVICSLYINYIYYYVFQTEEFIILADPSLSLFTADQESALDEIPQHKITDFR